MKSETLKINGLSETNLAYCEALGLSKVFQAYSELHDEYIIDSGIGFNPNSGYVYIALETGITICSMLGRDVEYLITDFETGEEYFFDNYETAYEAMTKMQII